MGSEAGRECGRRYVVQLGSLTLPTPMDDNKKKVVGVGALVVLALVAAGYVIVQNMAAVSDAAPPVVQYKNQPPSDKEAGDAAKRDAGLIDGQKGGQTDDKGN